MNEACSRETRRALFPLFAPGPQDALLLSVLQGHLGRAFQSDSGQSALLLARDFVFLAGKADADLLRDASAVFPSSFLTFSGSAAWLETARAWGACRAMTRYDLTTPAHFDERRLRALARPPAGYCLAPADKALYAACLAEEWSADLVAAFPTFPSFAAHGLAIVALKDGRPAAGCGAYAWADGLMEVEIDTHPDFRRQGLATACGAAFVLACLRRGLTPHWDAMTDVSRALAQKLGFGAARAYPVVCRAGE